MSFVVRKILSSVWAIQPEHVISLGDQIHKIIYENANYDFDEEENSTPNTEQLDINNYNIIVIRGELLKEDTRSGRVGMRTLGNMINEGEKSENKKGHILIIDSPGGTVDGTRELVKIIEGTKKPVVSVVDGMAASAAYWIASASDHILAIDEFAKVGSIGVMLSFADMQPYYEKQGVKFHRIYSDYSKDKNADFEKIIKGEYDDYIKENLNPIAIDFQQSVMKNRPSVIGSQITGKTFHAQDVIGSMIDGIGGVNEAIEFINKQQNNIQMEKQSFFAKVFGQKLSEKVETDEDLVLAQDKRITELEAENTILRKEKADAEAQIQKLATEKAEIEQQLSTAQIQIAELEQTPGALPTSVIKNSDSITTEEIVVNNEKSFHENLKAIKAKYEY